MDLVLWALQAILAVKFASAAYSHGLGPDPAKLQPGPPRFGAATRPLLILVALGALLGGLGLALPAALRSLAWGVPWAAALLAGMSLLAAGFHLACRQQPNVWVSLALAALAAFVAYGRWALAPL